MTEICSSLIVPQYLEMFNKRYHLWSQYNGQLWKFVEVNICWQLMFLPPTSHWSSLLLTNNKKNIAACILNCQKYYKAIFIKGCLIISDQNKHHFNKLPTFLISFWSLTGIWYTVNCRLLIRPRIIQLCKGWYTLIKLFWSTCKFVDFLLPSDIGWAKMC